MFSYFCMLLSSIEISPQKFNCASRTTRLGIKLNKTKKWKHHLHLLFVILFNIQRLLVSDKLSMGRLLTMAGQSMHYVSYISQRAIRTKAAQIVQLCNVIFRVEHTFPAEFTQNIVSLKVKMSIWVRLRTPLDKSLQSEPRWVQPPSGMLEKKSEKVRYRLDLNRRLD